MRFAFRNLVVNCNSNSITRENAVVERNAHFASGGNCDRIIIGTFASLSSGWIATLVALMAAFRYLGDGSEQRARP